MWVILGLLCLSPPLQWTLNGIGYPSGLMRYTASSLWWLDSWQSGNKINFYNIILKNNKIKSLPKQINEPITKTTRRKTNLKKAKKKQRKIKTPQNDIHTHQKIQHQNKHVCVCVCVKLPKRSVTSSVTWIYVRPIWTYNLMKRTVNNIHSLRKFDLGAKTPLLVKRYVKLPNRTMHVTRTAKCCHNKRQYRKCHHVTLFSKEVVVTMPKLTKEQRHNATGRLQAGANQSDITRHMGVCRATINRLWVYYNNTGSTKVRPIESNHPSPRSIHLVDANSG